MGSRGAQEARCAPIRSDRTEDVAVAVLEKQVNRNSFRELAGGGGIVPSLW